MSNLNKEPSMEGIFEVKVKGELTNKEYSGTFKCRILNAKLRAAAAKHKAFLNGENASNLDILTLSLHEQISYLRYALIEYPDFWKTSDLGYDLYDENVIQTVYESALAFEENYLRQAWGDEAVEKLKNGR